MARAPSRRRATRDTPRAISAIARSRGATRANTPSSAGKSHTSAASDSPSRSAGALAIELSPAELATIEQAIPAAAVAGTRYATPQMQHLDSER